MHQNVTIFGEDPDDKTGYSVASADVNGDTRSDIIIGAHQADGPLNSRTDCGEVYIIYSSVSIEETMNLSSQADVVIYGADNEDQLGYAITTGDLNNDSIMDIIVSSNQADGVGNGRGNSGEVYVIFGSDTLPSTIDLSSTSANITIYGSEADDYIGRSIGTGDVNGDNLDDLFVGSRADGPSNSRLNCGEINVVFGNSFLPTTIDLLSQSDIIIYGAESGDKAGISVNSGDFNNDGIDDIIIGAPDANGPGNARTVCGETYLIYGNLTLSSTIDLVSQYDMLIYGVDQTGMGSHLGFSVTSGDVNGDNIDDLIIGAYMERTMLYVGAVHIIFGAKTLPSIQDLYTTVSNVTILGETFFDNAGWSIACGDFNNDLFDDVVIGATHADGPGETRSECGEIYIVNGNNNLPLTIDLSLTSANVTIYGGDPEDGAETSQRGIAFAVGRIDNDQIDDLVIGLQLADGFKNTKLNSGEVYLILSSGDFSTLNPEFISLSNGDGVNGDTCYAKYKSYTFKVKVTDTESLTDLDTVRFSLDYNGENLQYLWTEATGIFTELNDPNDYTTLEPTSIYSNNGLRSWFIDFDITFHWTYPDNNFHSVQVYCKSDTDFYNWLNLSSEIYRVENRVNFTGELMVKGEVQGIIEEDDWVRGGEIINWDGLKVIYDDINKLYPIDPNIEVKVWDSDSDYWSTIPDPGVNITLNTTADIVTKINETYIINITGIPSFCDRSNVTFKLNIDADNVTFSNPFPNEGQWQTSLYPQCGITIQDSSTKVNTSSIEYKISTDNGTSWVTDWLDAEVQQPDSNSINCYVQPGLIEGEDNLICWRAMDIIGNGYYESDKYRIFVDISNVTFYKSIPTSDKWQSNLTVDCGITIYDNLSGINASSIEYQISTEGISGYTSNWVSAEQAINSKKINCSVSVTFKEGENNYIRWRTKDLAGNGPFISSNYQIRIKLNNLPVTTLISPSNNVILETLVPELTWSGTDPDGDSPIYYNLFLSTDEIGIINLDSSARLKFNFTNTKYKIEVPLEDGLKYFWTVIPNDGIIDGLCGSGIWNFRINTAVQIPKVTLLSPANNSKVNTQTPTLSWNIDYSNIELITYTLYLDTKIQFENYTSDIKSTSFVPSDPLLVDQIYYWKVIPVADTSDGLIEGICDSGIWNFEIETSLENVYGIDIKLEKNNITLKQSESDNVTITITNEGNVEDDFLIRFESVDITSANIQLSKSFLILNDGDSDQIFATITIPEDMESGSYTIKFIAESDDASDESILTITVNEIDDEEAKDTKSDTALYISIVVIVIILILIFIILFIYLKKKKGEDEETPVAEGPSPETPPPVQPPTPEVQPEQVPAPETPPTEQPQVSDVPLEQPPTPKVIPQVLQPQVEPAPEPAPMPQVEEQPTPQVEEQPPQVEAQEPAVEGAAEPQGQAPVPKIKTQLKEEDP